MKSSFWSRLTVMFCIWGMLGASVVVPVQAKIKPPFPCWTCCPDGPECNSQGTINQRIMLGHATTYINYQVNTGNTLTSSQYADMAGRIRNFQIEGDGDGAVEDINLWVKQYATVLKAPTINISQFTPGLTSMGSQATYQLFIKEMLTWTQPVRVTVVNDVLSYGFDWILTNAIADFRSLAMLTKEGKQPPMRTLCGFTGDVMDSMGFFAAVSLVTGDEPLAGAFGLIAGVAMVVHMLSGCNGNYKGKEFVRGRYYTGE